MIKYIPIQSGSGGNSAVLFNERTALVLDAGCPMEDVEKAMRKNYKSLSEFEAVIVFISHRHTDHIKYADQWEAAGFKVVYDYRKIMDWDLNVYNQISEAKPYGEYTIDIKGEAIWKVDVYYVDHDVANAGYRFTEIHSQRSIVWFTDAAKIPQYGLQGKLNNADIYLIELNNGIFARPIKTLSNHDQILYHNSKKRHMSDIKVITFLQNAIGPNTKNVHFLHLGTRIDQTKLASDTAANFKDTNIVFSFIESTSYPINDEIYIELDTNPFAEEMVKLRAL